MAGQKFPEVGLRAVFELSGFQAANRKYQSLMRDIDRTTQQTAQKVSRSGKQIGDSFARSVDELAQKSLVLQGLLQMGAGAGFMDQLSLAFQELGDNVVIDAQKFDQLVQSGVATGDALGQAAVAAKDVTESTQAASGSITFMGRQFTVAAVAIGAVTAALGASISLVRQSIDEYTELAEATRQLRTQTGLLTTEASGYVQALQSTGASAATSGRAMASFLSKVADMRREQQLGEESTNDFAKAMSFLDISVNDSAGNLKDTETLLREVNQRFQELGPGVRSTQVATDLFGYAGKQLLPILTDQRMTLEDYLGIVERYGSGLNALSQKEYADFRKANFQLQTSIQSVFNYIAQNYIPVLTQVQRILANLIGIYRTVVQGATDVIPVHELLARALERVADFLERVHTAVIAVASAWQRFTDILNPAAAAARALAQAEEETSQARAEAAQAAAEAAAAEEELQRRRAEILEQLGELKQKLAQKLADIDTDARQRWEDILVNRQRDAMDRAIQVAYRLYDLQQAYRERMDAIEADFAQRWDDILVKRQREAIERSLRETWQLEDLERSRLRSREQAIRDAARRESEIRNEANNRLRDAEQQARERRERLEREHLQRLADIRQKYLDTVQEAARDNDAVAVARAMRERARAIRDEQQRYQQEQADLEDSLAKQRESIERDRQERIADHRRELAERLQRIEENHQLQLEDLARQRERERILREMHYQWELEDFNAARERQQAAAREWYERQLEDLRQQQERDAEQRRIEYERQEVDFVKAWQRKIEEAQLWYEREREDLAEQLGMIGAQLEAAYAEWQVGAALAVDRWISEIERYRQYLAAATADLGIIGGRGITRTGGGTPTGGKARAPGAPVLGLQEGGVVYTGRPTTVMMGEGGPETAVFLPGSPSSLSVSHSFGRLGVDFAGLPAGLNTQQVQGLIYAVITQLAKGIQIPRG